MDPDFTKFPRLYSDGNLEAKATAKLDEAQAHYLKNVLRRKTGDKIRVFNGRDGEFLAEITGIGKKKADLAVLEQTRRQPAPAARIHLLFAPIKKDRMDFLIEKAVELGVTDFHPVLTARTVVRKINAQRLRAQVTEAAEQCERMEIPVLHPLAALEDKIASWKADFPVFWCRERGESPHISAFSAENWAFLIGPEGGFDDGEFKFLGSRPDIQPLSLGETLLRAETAAALALGYAKIQAQK